MIGVLDCPVLILTLNLGFEGFPGLGWNLELGFRRVIIVSKLTKAILVVCKRSNDHSYSGVASSNVLEKER